MQAVPEGMNEIGEICSYFDGVVDKEIEARVRAGEGYASYPGLNFFARVWFADGKFHAEVMVYRSHEATVTAATFEDLRGLICAQWGAE